MKTASWLHTIHCSECRGFHKQHTVRTEHQIGQIDPKKISQKHEHNNTTSLFYYY